MKLVYMGFTHETTGVRVYRFEGVVSQETRKGFVVTADIALLTKHHVQIQEVPMMCLRLLEGSAEAEPQLEILALTETDMVNHIQAKAAVKEQAAKKRAKRSFKPVNSVALGMAWRS